MSSPKKLLKNQLKVQIVPCNIGQTPNKIASRVLKIAKKFKGSNSIDDSIERDFLHEDGDPLNFLNPRFDKYENLGYIKLENKPFKKNSLSLNPQTEKSQKTSISRQSFDILRRQPSKIENFIISGTENKSLSHVLMKNQKTQQKIHNKLLENIKHKVSQRVLNSRRERSLKRYDLIKNKWDSIESALMLKVKKQSKDLLNNKTKPDKEKTESKLPSWITTLRSYKLETKYQEFIPVGNRLSGIFVRDIVRNNPLPKIKSSSCCDLNKILSLNPVLNTINSINTNSP